MNKPLYGEFSIGLEVWSMLLFGQDGPTVPIHSIDKLFEFLVCSPDLLSLYTQSKHIQQKIELKRGLRYYCFIKDFKRARKALAFGAHDHDTDIPACLMFLYQERCPEKHWDFVDELASKLSPRDANGLYLYFVNDEWKQLVASNNLESFDADPSKERVKDIFRKSRVLSKDYSVSFDHH